MSHDAIPSGVAMRPRFGLSPSAALEATAIAEAAATSLLRVDMLDLPILGNAPASDPIEMVKCLEATLGDEFGACRLDIAGVIGGAALQHRGPAIPAPRHTEPRQRHRHDRLLQTLSTRIGWQSVVDVRRRDRSVPKSYAQLMQIRHNIPCCVKGFNCRPLMVINNEIAILGA
jgi:hypothetical protein